MRRGAKCSTGSNERAIALLAISDLSNGSLTNPSHPIYQDILLLDCNVFFIVFISYWKCDFPMTPPVSSLVGRLVVCQSVGHDFPKRAESYTSVLLSEHLFYF